MNDEIKKLKTAAEKVAQIRADIKAFDGDKRGMLSALEDATDEYHEIVCRFPMLALIERTEAAERELGELKEQKPAAWSYECVQPGTDGKGWIEFINRDEIKPQEGVRKIKPLYAAHATSGTLEQVSFNKWEEAIKDAFTVAGEMGWDEKDPKGSIDRLIGFHVDIATNPNVNGGFSLQAEAFTDKRTSSAGSAVVMDELHEFRMYKSRKGHAAPYAGDGQFERSSDQAEYEAWLARSALSAAATQPAQRPMITFKGDGAVEKRIKTLMANIGMPNSTSLYTAMKQLQNEIEQGVQVDWKDAPVQADRQAAGATSDPITGPTYYVRHPDGSYSEASPQPIIAAVQPVQEPPSQQPVAWRVGEFWSSSNPTEKVLMLAPDERTWKLWQHRMDFIRWVSPAAAQAPAQTSKKESA